MNPQLFDFTGERKIKFRDEAVRQEISQGRLEFRLVRNDASHESYEILTGLKNIFQKQLPKMPREYITRLVYDRRHDSLAVLRRGNTTTTTALTPTTTTSSDGSTDTSSTLIKPLVIGGITFRLFEERGFCEIVFCAISSSEQVKGFGSAVMNQLKEQVRILTQGRVRHYLTYADNYAIGYFKKQGFTRKVTLDRSLWGGYIKDYDGGTLMQGSLVEGIDYLNIYPRLHEQKVTLVKEIDRVTGCAKVFPGLSPLKFPLADPRVIPGLLEAGWTLAMSKSGLGEDMRRGHLSEMLLSLLRELQTHPASWPFLKPVDPVEVPSYPQIISHPMDLSTMESKLETSQYHSLPEFIADFNLMIANCRTFNDPDTSYCKNANNLEKFFQDRLRVRDTHSCY